MFYFTFIPIMERKSINFELKDLDKSKRTAIIAHAVYDNIDRTEDISRKGMFTKSWAESKSDINFYLNHNDEQAPGKVVDVYEDEKAAYTKAWMGTHTLGNDVLTMMDEGIIKKASFGYITVNSTQIKKGDRKIRELKEVKHLETSVLTKMPANAKAGIISVTKAFEGITAIELKQFEDHLAAMIKFCRNTKASDECIKSILEECETVKNFISEYNTAFTLKPGPGASAWAGWFN